MAQLDEKRSTDAGAAARTVNIGLIGIGVGAAEILPAMESTPGIRLVAGADIVPETR